MSKVHAKISIDAPIERVWATVIDPDRLHEWVTIHRSVRNVSERPLVKGSTMEQVMHVRGLTFHVRWTLTDVEPPHRAEWQGRGPAHSRAHIRYDLSESPDGGTVFNYTNEFAAPGGRLGATASRLIVGDASDREARNSLDKLKALLERG
jgi:uncharacterized protein YndB with AHSA1/START domain